MILLNIKNTLTYNCYEPGFVKAEQYIAFLYETQDKLLNYIHVSLCVVPGY